MTQRTTPARLLALRDKIDELLPLVKAERKSLLFSSDSPYVYRIGATEIRLQQAISYIEDAAYLMRQEGDDVQVVDENT